MLAAVSYKMSLQEFNTLPAAQRVSLRRFGQRSRLYRNDFTLVAATALQVALNTPDRLSLLIVNAGVTNPATVTADGAKTTTQGSVIVSSGGAYALDAIDDGEACGYEFWAISTAGTTLHVEEIVGFGDTVELPPGVTPL